MRRGLLVTLLALLALVLTAGPAAPAPGGGVRVWRIAYRAHDGVRRHAYVLLPAWYGPRNHPAIPFVISPHGRGVTAKANTKLWGSLPAQGSFAVISPDGEGRKLPLYSWGSPGQIADLARMPSIATHTLPWLRIDRRAIYAVGGSMGGQETLLLLGKHPHLLAGAAALDSVTDLARQYRRFTEIPCNAACHKTWGGPLGRSLQALARVEIGGGPKTRKAAFADRSPVTYARAIAFSCVPLELWWSVKDEIVSDQKRQSRAFYEELLKLNPNADVSAYIGSWRHSAEMHASARLPAVLAGLGLLPPVADAGWQMHVYQPAGGAAGCAATAA